MAGYPISRMSELLSPHIPMLWSCQICLAHGGLPLGIAESRNERMIRDAAIRAHRALSPACNNNKLDLE